MNFSFKHMILLGNYKGEQKDVIFLCLKFSNAYCFIKNIGVYMKNLLLFIYSSYMNCRIHI